MPEQSGPAPSRSYAELFVISFVVLFFELACIRWFGSYVVFLTFFTNVVLIASFLGMSVGCLAASRKIDFMNWVPPLTMFTAMAAVGMQTLYLWDPRIVVDVGAQLSPERVYFGTEYRHPDLSSIVLPMELIAGFFFALIALIFVGAGQVMGRCLDRIPNRVLAYTTNILGSLVGIVAFAVISIFRLSPLWWFAVALGGCCYFLTGGLLRRITNWGFVGTTILFVGLIGWGVGGGTQIFWSPYYRIDYRPAKRGLLVNNIGHQSMKELGSKGLAYVLPYVLSRDAQRPPIQDVLVIGAGTGNDVSAALWAGVEHVDGVEIDPIIYDLGRRYHPDRPYQDPRVAMHLNDGRNFLKQGDRRYDLVVYALVDSLVLHSGYSSIRLENFLFTRQAFADVKARLKEHGLFVMYNYFRQGWIVARLTRMVQEAFGREPLVFSLPYRSEIFPSTSGGFTMILVGDTDRLAEAFRTRGSYWIPSSDFLKRHHVMGFGLNPPVEPPGDDLVKIGLTTVRGSKASDLLPADSWPFLYLKGRQIPALNFRGMATMGLLSLLILGFFAPKGTIRLNRFNWSMFFLGAGFMLLETKGVVHMALLFGSTWTVNSIVFFAILVMILLSNLFVLRRRPTRLTGYYAALVVALGLNIVVDLDVFLGLPQAVRIVGSSLMVFIPIFFAGVIFAAIFRQSVHADQDFGANVAGVVLGGIAENFSLVLGFGHLLWLAIGFYLLSRVFQPQLSLRAG
ncbi:MAG: spermidine synthase [Nitrospinota bacterium]